MPGVEAWQLPPTSFEYFAHVSPFLSHNFSREESTDHTIAMGKKTHSAQKNPRLITTPWRWTSWSLSPELRKRLLEWWTLAMSIATNRLTNTVFPISFSQECPQIQVLLSTSGPQYLETTGFVNHDIMARGITGSSMVNLEIPECGSICLRLPCPEVCRIGLGHETLVHVLCQDFFAECRRCCCTNSGNIRYFARV